MLINENRFMRDNGANIPSSFCPFLANKFPKLNVEQIMSHIEEDFPIEPMGTTLLHYLI